MYAVGQRHPAKPSGKGAGRSSFQRLFLIVSDIIQTSFHTKPCLAFKDKLAHLKHGRVPGYLEAWGVRLPMSTSQTKIARLCKITKAPYQCHSVRHKLRFIMARQVVLCSALPPNIVLILYIYIDNCNGSLQPFLRFRFECSALTASFRGVF